MNNSNGYDNKGEYYTPYDEASQVNNPLAERKGTTSMILGIISLVSAITVIFAPLALVLGIIAIVKGKKYKSDSFNAKAGFILGIISVVISAIILIGLFLLIKNGIYYSYNYQSPMFFNNGFHRSFYFHSGFPFFHRYF